MKVFKKIFNLQGIGSILCGVLLCSSLAFAKTVEQYIEEARTLLQEGDLASAAVSYQKALKLDQQNMVAKRELKDVLLEARRLDPEVEQTEAEWALLEEQRATRAKAELEEQRSARAKADLPTLHDNEIAEIDSPKKEIE